MNEKQNPQTKHGIDDSPLCSLDLMNPDLMAALHRFVRGEAVSVVPMNPKSGKIALCNVDSFTFVPNKIIED